MVSVLVSLYFLRLHSLDSC